MLELVLASEEAVGTSDSYFLFCSNKLKSGVLGVSSKAWLPPTKQEAYGSALCALANMATYACLLVIGG